MESFNDQENFKISKFMELSAENDRKKCINFLKKFDWKLEDAIIAYISGHLIPGTRTIPSDSGESTQDILVADNSQSSFFRSLYESALTIIKIPFWICFAILDFLKSMIFSSTEDVSKNQFYAFFHPYFPNTLGGSFQNCLSRTFSQKKIFLCVTLENYSEKSFEEIKTLLLDPSIEPILKENFMIWGNSFDTGREDISEFPITSFPNFEIMMKSKGRVVSLINKNNTTDVNTLAGLLNEALDKFKKSSTLHTRRNDENRARHILMRKQEEEFNESLKKDLEKQREVSRLEKTEQQKKEKEEANQRETFIRKQKFMEFRQNCQSKQSDSESSSNQNFITLKIKYPDGFVSHVSLSPDQSISVLYKHIIESKEDLLSNFHIFSSYPKKHLSMFDISKHIDQHHPSLVELDLNRSQVLMVEYSSDEE